MKDLGEAEASVAGVVLGLGNRSHIGKKQFQELNWLPVEERVRQLKLNMVHNIVNHRVPKYLNNYFTAVGESHRHNTRASMANLRPKISFKSKMGQRSLA